MYIANISKFLVATEYGQGNKQNAHYSCRSCTWQHGCPSLLTGIFCTLLTEESGRFRFEGRVKQFIAWTASAEDSVFMASWFEFEAALLMGQQIHHFPPIHQYPLSSRINLSKKFVILHTIYNFQCARFPVGKPSQSLSTE